MGYDTWSIFDLRKELDRLSKRKAALEKKAKRLDAAYKALKDPATTGEGLKSSVEKAAASYDDWKGDLRDKYNDKCGALCDDLGGMSKNMSDYRGAISHEIWKANLDAGNYKPGIYEISRLLNG